VDDFILPGEKHLAKGQYTRALEWFERALVLEPESGRAWYGLGQTYLALGQEAKGEEAWTNSLALNYPQAITRLAELYRIKGWHEREVNTLTVGLDKYNTAADREKWYRRLIEAYTEMKMLDQAADLYVSLLEEFPSNYEYWIGYAYLLQKSEPKSSKQISILQEFINQYGDVPEVFFALGEIHEAKTQFSEARHWFEKAAIARPDNQWWQLKYLRILRRSGDYSNALILGNQLVSKFPQAGIFPFELALVQSELGDHASATKNMSNALDLLDEPSVAQLVQAGIVFEASLDINSARLVYEKALKLDPDNLEAVYALMRLLSH
jgi:tetratricopeptide (TPR) repeat protein